MNDDKKRTQLPGWKAILVREDTFKKLQNIQRGTIDPFLDLRYIGDAAVSIALDANGDDAVVMRARTDLKSRL